MEGGGKKEKRDSGCKIRDFGKVALICRTENVANEQKNPSLPM